MTTRFTIRIAQASTPELIHRLRNFGEDLSRLLGDKGTVDMAEVDSATEFFVVEVASSRFVGDVGALLRKTIASTSRDGAFSLERS